MELVFVSNNPGKVREIENLLGDSFVLKSLKDLGVTRDIPETSSTLEGNASEKARYIYSRFGLDCFADDTGLEVEALNNQPGVYSARYAELGQSGKFENRDELTKANISKLLRMLEGKNLRKARFRTVISLITGGREMFFEGVAEGEILTHERGEGGFGYDGVFLPAGHNKTFAEMTLDEKNRISHRAIAFSRLVSFLKQLDL